MKRNKREKTGMPSAGPGGGLSQAASMTECTGILPAQIESAQEGEAVAALQNIPPVKPPKKK